MQLSINLPRVLLDECLPRKLKSEFAGCTVSTVPEIGWSGTKNGALMKLANRQFEIFVTADQNLKFQQNLAYAEIAVIVLVARNNRIESLSPLMPQVKKVAVSNRPALWCPDFPHGLNRAIIQRKLRLGV